MKVFIAILEEHEDYAILGVRSSQEALFREVITPKLPGPVLARAPHTHLFFPIRDGVCIQIFEKDMPEEGRAP